MISLNKIRPEDIDEKIELQKKDGIDIYKLKEHIEEELKDFEWIEIRAKVQCQSYREQLSHINKRIKEQEVQNGVR